MHAVKLLHTWLGHACPSIHSQRLNALMDATKTLSEDHHLSITGIGRGMKNNTSAKHNIKRIDRLVGNPWIHSEKNQVYATIIHHLLQHNRQPIILIDWSDLTADRRQQLLRAAIPMGGRSLTIYEEIHPIHKQANRVVHRNFLKQLYQLLPKHIMPIVVTDAGFRGTWFKLVNQLNWHWVGRVRNRDYIKLDQKAAWQPCKTLYPFASTSSKSLGEGLLSRSQPNKTLFYIYKKAKQGRIEKSKLGNLTHNSRSNKIARREREPWLIVTSPSLKQLTAKQVMSIYKKRMQIEEGFRDIKCERYGLGLANSLTKAAKRLEILLLLGALALIAIWMTGVSAIKQKQHYHFQSNTTRTRNVLSSIFMGMQVMKFCPSKFTKSQLLIALNDLRKQPDYGAES